MSQSRMATLTRRMLGNIQVEHRTGRTTWCCEALLPMPPIPPITLLIADSGRFNPVVLAIVD